MASPQHSVLLLLLLPAINAECALDLLCCTLWLVRASLGLHVSYIVVRLLPSEETLECS